MHLQKCTVWCILWAERDEGGNGITVNRVRYRNMSNDLFFSEINGLILDMIQVFGHQGLLI